MFERVSVVVIYLYWQQNMDETIPPFLFLDNDHNRDYGKHAEASLLGRYLIILRHKERFNIDTQGAC